MGKTISETDMPKSCHDCKMLTMISENVGCDLYKDTSRPYMLSRHPDCPIKTEIIND